MNRKKDEEEGGEEYEGVFVGEGNIQEPRKQQVDEGEVDNTTPQRCAPLMWNCNWGYERVGLSEGESKVVGSRGCIDYLLRAMLWGNLKALWNYLEVNKYTVYSILTYEVFCISFDSADEIIPVWSLAETSNGKSKVSSFFIELVL